LSSSGGTGLVGRFIVADLLTRGEPVIVAGRTAPPAGHFASPIEFRPLDLDPAADHSALLSGVTHLVHCAFHHLPGRYRGGEGDDPSEFVRLNRDGTIALFRTARACGVERVVFLSSRAVYGPKPADAVLDEDAECRPDTLYGQVKLEAEWALADLAASGFQTCSLRATGVYGAPRPDQPHKWEELFRAFTSGQALPARVGTEVHGRDLAATVWLALHSDKVPQVMNVSDILIDTRMILERFQQATGQDGPLPEPGDLAGFNPMTTARLKALGWRPGGMALFEEEIQRLAEAFAG
jgi:nucleoside-diphosphate-sugar epimerase